jgi:pimeloyl-ACP methyl ester carboxylesterase
MAVSEQLLAAAKDKPEKAYRMINQWSNAQGLGGNTVPGAWQPGASLALMRRTRAGSLFIDLSNCNDYQSGLEAASQVACPALLVIAKRDLMTPPRATGDLAKALKDVRKAEIDGAGHAMMAEQPDRVLDALRAFLL